MLNVIMNFETVEGTIALLSIAIIGTLFFGLPLFLILKAFEQEEKEYKKHLEELSKNNQTIASGAPANNMLPHITLMNSTIFTL